MCFNDDDARSIFLTAVEDYLPAQWDDFVQKACGQDVALRQRVQRLLAAHQGEDSVLDRDEGVVVGNALQDRSLGDVPDTQIGPYKLLEKLGEGGMGVVYLAEQTTPVERRVALKIIKPGMDTQQIIARFEAERQALAMMDHPHIAKVLDAGSTEQGLPYFVMELVDGVPITQYCDHKHLALRERLALFIPVCEAVQHAHQKGIIHRDIKPSNVLVALCDDRPSSKVIDFGVAKATRQPLSEETNFTLCGQFVGTLDYMSPEQAGLNPMDIDTRSDIYSLGGLLYELLVGETPFDRQRLRSMSLEKLLRTIREEEPPRASVRLSTCTSLGLIAANRDMEPKRLQSAMRGELDWIVMKALAKDRAHRYGTANELALDIARYLDNQPIEARPPSKVYLLRKFVRRNRLPVTASACVIVALLLTGFFAVLAHSRSLRETEARLALQQVELDKRDAETRARVAEADKVDAEVTAFVEKAQRLSSGMFPDFRGAVRLLDLAIEHRSGDARLHLYRGGALHEMGQYEEAIADLERSLELDPGETGAANWLVATAAQELGDSEKASRHLELAKQRSPSSIESLVVQALAAPYDERGIELLTRAIELEPFDPMLYYHRGRCTYNVATRKTSRRLYDAAVRDLEKALRGRPGDDRIFETLCRCLVGLDFLADPEQQPLEYAKQLIDRWVAASPDSAPALAILANWQLVNGQKQNAIDTSLDAIRLDPQRAESVFIAGWAYRTLGRYQEAIEYLTRGLALSAEQRPHERPPAFVSVYAGLAVCRHALGQQDLARDELAKACHSTPPRNWNFYDWYHLFAALNAMGQQEQGLVWAEKYVELSPQCSCAYLWRGRFRLALEQRQPAIEDLENAIKLLPHDPSAYVSMLEIYLHEEQFDKALELCDAWAETVPSSSHPFRWRGLFHYQSKSYAEALRDLDSALQQDSRDARAYYHRGRTRLALKQHDLALFDFDQAVALNPADPDVYRARAQLFLDDKRFEQCVNELSLALKYGAENAETYRRRGEALRQLDRYEPALADFDRAIELDPRNASAYDSRGLVHAAQGQYEEALSQYARALEIDPVQPWARQHMVDTNLATGDVQEALRCCHVWAALAPTASEPFCSLATVQSKSGDHQAALDSLSQALENDPEDHRTYLQRGRVYADLHHYAKALADYDQVLKLNPDWRPRVAYSRGLANAKLGHLKQAIADFTIALDYNKNHSWLYCHRSDAYRRSGLYKQALADCDRAIEIAPQDADFRFFRGRILLNQDRSREALQEYQAGLKLKPDLKSAQAAIVNAYCNLGDYVAATAFCHDWISRQPDLGIPYRYRGFVHFCSGDYEKALSDYALADQRSPDDYMLHFHRGQVLWMMGRTKQGRADIEQSLANCPRSEMASHCRVVGEFYGELELWHDAESILTRAVELDSGSVATWHLLAVLRLSRGDTEGYQDTVQEMLRRFGQTVEPTVAELVARTGVLHAPEGDAKPLLALANQALEASADAAACHAALGSVLYRMGRLEESIAQLEDAAQRCRTNDADQHTTPVPLACFLAMAYAHQGDLKQADLWKKEALLDGAPMPAWREPPEAKLPDWCDRRVTDLLRREVESVVQAEPDPIKSR